MLLAGACKKSLCAKTAILPPSNKKFYLLTALIIIIIKAIFVSPAYAATPSVGTISPSYGSSPADTAITFTATYSDPSGWAHIQLSYLLINTSITGSNCFWGYYNQNNNKLYIRDDAGKKWLGGYSPGTSNTIENSYAKLDCSKTIISGSGNTLTVKWNVTFKDTFLGQKKSYLYVQDDSNLSASWTQKGAWKIYLNQRLTNITPPSGSILYIDQVNTIDADAENYVSNTTLKYRFWLGTTLLQDWTTNDKYSWTPVSSNIGTCNIKVEVGINHTVGHSKTLGYCIARKPILAE
jgi:hypothetical protein